MEQTAKAQAQSKLEDMQLFREISTWLKKGYEYEELSEEARELLEDHGGGRDMFEEYELNEIIWEYPLSVEVRSAWHAPGLDSDPAEYRIVLCTGGPHVELVGDLETSYSSPANARFEYQWATEHGTMHLSGEDLEAAILFAERFHFGE